MASRFETEHLELKKGEAHEKALGEPKTHAILFFIRFIQS